jgi:hypothetical protein
LKARDEIAQIYDEGPEFIMENTLIGTLEASQNKLMTESDIKRCIEKFYAGE